MQLYIITEYNCKYGTQISGTMFSICLCYSCSCLTYIKMQKSNMWLDLSNLKNICNHEKSFNQVFLSAL